MTQFEKNGFIKLNRKLMNKKFYSTDSEKVHLWVHLLFKAIYKEEGKEEYLGNKKIICQQGQFTTGRKQLSQETGISESKIERILTYFEKTEQQIEQQKSNKNRLITIINWRLYNISEQQTEQQVNNSRTTSEQQVNNSRTHYNKDNKDNNINKEDNINKVSNNYLPNLDFLMDEASGKCQQVVDEWNNVLCENFGFSKINPEYPNLWGSQKELIKSIKEIWDIEKIMSAITNSTKILQKNKNISWYNPENIKKALAGNFDDDNFKNKTQKNSDNEQIEINGIKLDKWITVEGVKYEKYYYEPKDMASQLLYENKAEEEYEKTKSVEKSRELILKNLKKFDYVKRFHYHKDNFKRWLVLLINSNIKMRLKKMGIENLGEAEQYVQYI